MYCSCRISRVEHKIFRCQAPNKLPVSCRLLTFLLSKGLSGITLSTAVNLQRLTNIESMFMFLSLWQRCSKLQTYNFALLRNAVSSHNKPNNLWYLVEQIRTSSHPGHFSWKSHCYFGYHGMFIRCGTVGQRLFWPETREKIKKITKVNRNHILSHSFF